MFLSQNENVPIANNVPIRKFNDPIAKSNGMFHQNL
jgi:hypothetical protein